MRLDRMDGTGRVHARRRVGWRRAPEQHAHQVGPGQARESSQGAIEALLLRDHPEELGKRGALPAHPFFAGGGSMASGAQMMRWQDGQMSVSSVVFKLLKSCGGTLMLQPWQVPATTVTSAGERRLRTVS